ncbi:hypothetical protein ACFL2T_07990 [Elusimicrobiota bacterium]
MKKIFTIVAAAFFVATSLSSSAASSRQYVLKDIQVYGSEAVSPEQIRESQAELIGKFLRKRGMISNKAKRLRKELLRTLESNVKELGDFGWVRVRLVERGLDDGKRPTLFLFDVIEKKDMATRFPFRSKPVGQVDDVSGLIELWQGYFQKGKDAVDMGESGVDRLDCPAYYCIEGVPDEDSRRLEQQFAKRVPDYKDLLVKIMREDKSSKRRASAVYLLSYLNEGAEVSRLVGRGLLDPSQRVREAVFNVFNDIAVQHREVPLPIHEIARAMDFPYPGDRLHALAVMLSLADHDDYRDFLVTSASDRIVKHLRLKNPSTQEMAHTVLTLLSGESHGSRDYDAWEKWLWKATQKGGKD